MTPPRISVGWLMFAVILLAVPVAIVVNTINGHAWTGANRLTDLGLWPGLDAFGMASFRLATRRRAGSPFLWGFAATGWAVLLAYLALCLETRLVEIPILFYVNDLGEWGFAWLTDLESYAGYALNLLILGLVLATPQLILAAVGGLIARRTWGARWTST